MWIRTFPAYNGGEWEIGAATVEDKQSVLSTCTWKTKTSGPDNQSNVILLRRGNETVSTRDGLHVDATPPLCMLDYFIIIGNCGSTITAVITKKKRKNAKIGKGEYMYV